MGCVTFLLDFEGWFLETPAPRFDTPVAGLLLLVDPSSWVSYNSLLKSESYVLFLNVSIASCLPLVVEHAPLR